MRETASEGIYILPKPLQAPEWSDLTPEARRLLDAASEFGQNGAKLFEKGNYQEAKKNFLRCLSLIEQAQLPDIGAGERFHLALCHVELKDFPQAINEMEKARNISLRRGEHQFVLGCSMMLADIYLRAKEFKQFAAASQRCMEDAVTMAPEEIQKVIDLHVQFFSIAINQPDPFDAIGAVLEVSSRLHQSLPEMFAASNSELNEIQKRKVSMGLFILGEAHDSILLAVKAYNQGLQLVRKGQLRKALPGFSRSLKSAKSILHLIRPKPFIASILYTRGRIHEQLESLKQALADYGRCVKLQPDNPVYYNCRGIVYFRMKKYRKALKEFEAALEIQPNHMHALMNAGSALLRLKRYPQALEKVKTIIEIDAQDIEALLMRGEIEEAMGHDVEALEAYNAAVEIQPNSSKARTRRMLFHASKNRWTLAARDLCILFDANASELVNYPKNFLVHILTNGIDECVRIDMNSDDMRHFAELVLKIDKNNDLALSYRGVYYLVHQKFDDALRDFSAAIEINDSEYRHFFYRGQIYEIKGDLRNAEADYTRASNLNPMAQDIKEKIQKIRQRLNKFQSKDGTC